MKPARSFMSRWMVAGCLALLSPGFFPGCANLVRDRGAPGSIRLWAVDDMTDVTPDKTPAWSESFDEASRRVRLHAASNETVSFQLVLQAAGETIESVEVHLDDPSGQGRGRIARSAMTFYRMEEVSRGMHPAWWIRLGETSSPAKRVYDPLVPVDTGESLGPLPPGRQIALWVDVAVPRSARPGPYTTELRLESNGRLLAAVTVDLTVHEFVLSDALSTPAVGGFGNRELFAHFLRRQGEPFTPLWMDRQDETVVQGLTILRQMLRLGRAHRLDLFDVDLRPTLKRDGSGRPVVFWQDYDAVALPYLDGTAFPDGVGVAMWPAPFDETWPAVPRYGGFGAKDYDATVSAVLADTAEHFRSLGVTDRIFAWPIRGRWSREAYDRFEKAAQLIRDHAPGLPILTQLSPDGPMNSDDAASAVYCALVDLLAVPADRFDPSAPLVRSLHTAGVRRRDEAPTSGAFLAPGLPPYMPSLGLWETPAGVRAVPWLAWGAGLRGLFLPEVLHWGDDPFTHDAEGAPRLFYPGKRFGRDEVVPSIRLKRLRRGLQDVAYLDLLRQLGYGAVAESICRTMARYVALDAAGDDPRDARLNGWTRDGESWIRARRLLAAEVTAAVNPSTETRRKAMAERLAWQQFGDEARRLRVERIRSGFDLVGEELRIRLLLDLFNEMTHPAAVRASLPTPPQSITLAGSEQVDANLDAGELRTLELALRCPVMSAGPAGKLAVPLRLQAERGEPRTLQAQAPILLAGRPLRPIVVDGDLSEWPLRLGNSAGRFRLMGRRGRQGTGLPSRQTNAFVLYDEEAIYIAFRCDQPAGEPLVTRATNLVRMDRLLAHGEDLVEVVFNPGQTARDASDLYRILVKANGVAVAGRGRPSDGDPGPDSAWSAGAGVAVGRDADAWFVEIAIPRQAFGQVDSNLWGVNFYRYCPATIEASNWAEAPRHIYDPTNLGALLLP